MYAGAVLGGTIVLLIFALIAMAFAYLGVRKTVMPTAQANVALYNENQQLKQALQQNKRPVEIRFTDEQLAKLAFEINAHLENGSTTVH